MTDVSVPPFFLNSFVATVPGTSEPVTEFANSAQIQLAWQSNGTSFTVYAAQDAQPVYTGTAPTCVVPGRRQTTTFVLAASVTGGPDSGTPNRDFETITLYETLTVTIRNPNETPQSVTAGLLSVNAAAELRGDTKLGSTTVGGGITVTGPAGLDGGASASGLTVSGAADLRGTTTLQNATITGQLTVNGATSLAGATVANLTVGNSVQMMAPRSFATGTWQTASTDGILVGAVSFPSNPGQRCSAQLQGYSQGIGWIYATGGNTVIFQDVWTYTMWGNANTFSVPVQRFTPFIVNVFQVNDRQADAPTGAWWVPFGRNATLTELSVDEAVALGVPDEVPTPAFDPVYDPSTGIAQLVDVIRDLAGGDLPSATEEKFTAALWSLVHVPHNPNATRT